MSKHIVDSAFNTMIALGMSLEDAHHISNALFYYLDDQSEEVLQIFKRSYEPI